ncbi:MAG: hybrid sensor histidine kinase/response regulator [Deltaproteobacteria bacterium]|nr:hybrid sensor histidine kinase/response regulator [Deltaproteobacteria bacterium]
MNNALILVVEDSALIRKKTTGLLTGAGFQVVEAADGEEALLKVRETRPKLVLLDLIMPRLGGMEVMRVLRDSPQTRTLPVVLVSALEDKPTRLEGLERGADAYLTKPYDNDELLALVHNLTSKRLELENLDSLREERLHMEVHDLKNPLGNIITTCELLLNFPLEEKERRELIEGIARSAKATLGMVMNHLQVGGLESGQFHVTPSPLNPAEAVLSALNQVSWLAGEKKVALTANLPPDALPLTADREILIRVLVNLAENAVKNTPAGGSVVLGLVKETGGLRFLVKDTGRGIPPEFLPRVFEKFARQSSSGSHSTGLGLTFCKLAVEAHGGSVAVESEPGKGSLFSFVIPS